MLISTLFPTRDRPEWVPRAVASVLAQTHTDWELIVMDNGREPAKLPEDPRIRVVPCEPQPVAGLYNMALKLARGEVVCHFADDDELPPHALATVAQRIGDADWLIAATELRDMYGNVITHRGGSRAALERTRAGEYWLGGAVYWRKTLSDAVGGYDERYDGAADFDLFLRFAAHSEPAIIGDVLYLYTDHPDTDSRRMAGRQFAASQAIRERVRS